MIQSLGDWREVRAVWFVAVLVKGWEMMPYLFERGWLILADMIGSRNSSLAYLAHGWVCGF